MVPHYTKNSSSLPPKRDCSPKRVITQPPPSTKNFSPNLHSDPNLKPGLNFNVNFNPNPANNLSTSTNNPTSNMKTHS